MFKINIFLCVTCLTYFLSPITMETVMPIAQRKPCCNRRPMRTIGLKNQLAIGELLRVAGGNRRTMDMDEEEDSKSGFFGPPPFIVDDSSLKTVDAQKALACSLLCLPQELNTPVCACNFNTGNVVTFRDKCDLKKHNCRFDTVFKTILNEVCPWEFESRRTNSHRAFEYTDSKYYN